MTDLIDKGATYDNVKGVFADLDDGGLTDDEALAQIRKLVGAGKPLPDKVVLVGALPFTIVMDTRTFELSEFEVNYDMPTFGDHAEKRISGEALDIEDWQLAELIEKADQLTPEWPEPERM